MIDNKSYKIFEKVFSLKELDDVHQFVVKKLNVEDLYKVRDKFEGNQFLINTTRKVFMLKSLFQFLNIENYQKIKIGFLNTINTDVFISCKISFLEFENEIINLNLQPNTVYCVVNQRSRYCVLFSKNLEYNEIKYSITQNLKKHKTKIIYNQI